VASGVKGGLGGYGWSRVASGVVGGLWGSKVALGNCGWTQRSEVTMDGHRGPEFYDISFYTYLYLLQVENATLNFQNMNPKLLQIGHF
jgi:hypothetical protein